MESFTEANLSAFIYRGSLGWGGGLLLILPAIYIAFLYRILITIHSLITFLTVISLMSSRLDWEKSETLSESKKNTETRIGTLTLLPALLLPAIIVNL